MASDSSRGSLDLLGTTWFPGLSGGYIWTSRSARLWLGLSVNGSLIFIFSFLYLDTSQDSYVILSPFAGGRLFFLVYPFAEGVGLQGTQLWCWDGVSMSKGLFSLLPQSWDFTVLVSAYAQKLPCYNTVSPDWNPVLSSLPTYAGSHYSEFTSALKKIFDTVNPVPFTRKEYQVHCAIRSQSPHQRTELWLDIQCHITLWPFSPVSLIVLCFNT